MKKQLNELAKVMQVANAPAAPLETLSLQGWMWPVSQDGTLCLRAGCGLFLRTGPSASGPDVASIPGQDPLPQGRTWSLSQDRTLCSSQATLGSYAPSVS